MARQRPAPTAIALPLVTALAVTAALLLSCRATAQEKKPRADPAHDAPAWGLVEDFESMPREEFEGYVGALRSINFSVGNPIPDRDLDELARLANDPERHELALRAALVLDALLVPRAAERLLALLELREERPTRPADAALCVAAAALAGWPADFSHPAFEDHVARLVALSLDDDPHPDLEVRVECARSALMLGDESVGPFLLRVTRLGTPLGLERDGDWRSAVTTTWSRHRAAEALADHLGVTNPYHGDAPLAERETGALELERLWNELTESPALR